MAWQCEAVLACVCGPLRVIAFLDCHETIYRVANGAQSAERRWLFGSRIAGNNTSGRHKIEALGVFVYAVFVIERDAKATQIEDAHRPPNAGRFRHDVSQRQTADRKNRLAAILNSYGRPPVRK